MRTIVRSILPHPLLSVGLFIMWLLLNQSLSPGQIIIGAVVGLTAPLALTLLEPPPARIRRPGAIFRLAWRVLIDIIYSNIAVARLILGMKRRERNSGFVNIPLKLRNPYGLALLGTIITSTPGTVWVNFDSATGVLMIHVLDLVEESDWLETVQQRYESLLLEIFA